MASMINSVRIQFANTGLNEILQHQKKMTDNAKTIADLAKKELQALEKSGASEAELKEKRKEVKELEKNYKALKATLEGMGAEFNTIKNAIENIDSIGPNMVNKLLNSIKRFSKNAGSLTDETSEKLRVLGGTVKDVATALSTGFQKGVVDLTAPINKDASFSELKGIKEQYEQFGKVLAQSSNNYDKTLKLMGERATEAKIKMGEMDGTLKSINKNSSVENIKNYIKGWQEVANYSGATKAQVKNAEQNVKSGQQALLSEYARRAQAGTSTYTPQEVQDAIKGLKDLQQTANLSATAQKKINLAIAEGEENLKRYAAEGKRQVMEKQLQNVSKLSKSALQEQRKYWQEVMNNAVDSKGANAARQNLENINNLLRQRQQLSVQQSGLLNYQQGMGGNIDTLKENIKTLQEYRATLNSTDVSGLTQVDNAIKNMTADLRAANENALLAKNALTTLGQGGALTGTVEDLQKTKSGLLEMRNQVDVTSKEGKQKIQQIDKAILSVDSAIRKATMDEQRFNEILKNPQGVYSLNELKVVYDQLEQEIKQAGIAQKEFEEKSKQMKNVKRRMEELQGAATNTTNAFTRVKNKLTELVAYKFSAYAIIGNITNTTKQLLELSDQMTNVQKVTNMSNKEISQLVNNLQELDTRTSAKDLMAYAEQAGKLGIYDKYGLAGMQGFVEMGEKIGRTLGEDIGGAKAIADLAKLNDILGVTKSMGNDVGRALDATGSAILNLGNKSAASYESIVNYVGRTGALGKTLKMTVPELVALGGTLDALKMPAESGSTALNQILASLQTRSSQLAQAAGVSAAAMEELVGSGKTYEALLMLLDAMNRGAVNAQGLMDVMGGRSKSSVQIRNVWNLLANGADSLANHLEIAKEGFDSVGDSMGLITEGSREYLDNVMKQSVMTAEFNRVNSNAAGIMQRFGNRMKEIFVNSTAVNVLTSIVSLLNRFVKWLYDGNKATAAFRGTLEALVITLILVKTQMNLAIVQGFKAMATSLVSGVAWLGRFSVALVKSISFLWRGKAALVALNAELKVLSSGTWITLIITAVITIGNAIWSTYKKSEKLLEAFRELQKEEEAEIRHANTLFNSLKDVNDETGKRAGLLKQINENYGDYIGFLIDEATNNETIAAAHDKVIAKLREEGALKRQNAALNVVEKAHGEDIAHYYSDMLGDIDKITGISDRDKDDIKDWITAYINTAIKNTKGKLDSSKILEGLFAEGEKRRVVQTYTTLGGRKEEHLINPIYKIHERLSLIDSDLEDYIEEVVAYENDFRDIITRMTKDLDDLGHNVTSNDTTVNNLKETSIALAKSLYEKDFLKVLRGRNYSDLSEEELKSLVNSLEGVVGNLADYKKDADVAKYLEDNSIWQKLSDLKTLYQEKRATSIRYAIYGKEGATYSKWSSKKLSDTIKEYNKLENELKEGVNVELAFPKAASKLPKGLDEEEMRKWLYDEASKMRDILIERNEGIGADWKWDDEKDSEAAKKAKETYEAAIADLDAYYKEKENLISIQLNKEEITEAEAERKKRINEVEHMQQRAKLRRNAMGELKAKEQEDFEDWWSGVEKLDAVNWERLREQSEEWGKAYRQKQKLGVQKDLSEVEKLMRAHKVKIDKILAEGAPMKELAMEFGSAMDELDMIFGANEKDRNKNLAAQRLTQLLKWGEDAYELSVDALKSEMENEEHVFNAWYKQLGDDKDRELTAMLMRLQQFNDDLMEVGRKAAKESERIFKTRWEGEIQENGQTRKMQEEDSLLLGEAGVRAGGISENWRHGGTVLTGDMELDLIQMQIKAKEKYIQALKGEQEAKIALSKQREQELMTAGNEQALAEQRMETANLEMETNLMLADSYTLLNELRQQETEKAIESYNRTFGSLGEMADAFDKFAQSFGEGIFGSKEDRKQAGKELLIDSLQVMKKLAQQYLIEVATAKITNETKLLLYRQYAAQKQLIDLQMLQAQGVTEINGLSITAAVASAETAVDAARGTGKEVAKLGLKGLLVGAAISAGLSLLMGAAMSKINKSKSEVASASGASAGKLATGMLTYAEGKYPSNYEAVPHSTGIGKYANGVTYNVEGNDGRSYNARYTKSLKTGIYHGPHMAVFSENGDEMVIDSPTLRRMPPRMIADIMAVKHGLPMMMDYGRISEAMNTLSLSRTRSLANMGRRNGIRTYADGNIDEVGGELLAGYNTIGGANGHGGGNDELTKAVKTLNAILASGIGVNMYGQDGLRKSLDKDERWRKRNRLS